jgi:hypothetical protein
MYNIKKIYISVFILTIFIAYAYSASINATVLVQCPFGVNLNTHTVYPKLPNQTANFTIYTTVNCIISNMSGKFFIIESNGSVVYTQSINNINATQKTSTYKFNFDPSNIPNGLQNAKISFTYFKFTNYSSNKILLNNITNVIIKNFSTSQKLLMHSNQQFYISLRNIGGFALSNSISIKLRVIGPSNASLNFPSNYSLAPLQYLNITATMTNLTVQPGNYKAMLNVTYPTNNTNGIVLTSKYNVINYTVISPPVVTKPIQLISPPIHIITIPQFSLISFPFALSLNTNQSTLEIVKIKNNVNTTEYVNISVPGSYKNLVNLSATNLAITPKQTVGIDIAFTAQKIYPPGSYIIPININASILNSSASETAYTTLSIYNSTTSHLLPSIILMNNTKDASGIIKITNPTNKNFTNMVVKAMLPINVTKSALYINSYGLPSQINTVNGSYIISWYINNLPTSSTTFAYFSISNITAQPMLNRISSLLTTEPIPVSSSILKIVDIDVPTYYVNSSNYIRITLLYTGTQKQKIAFYLTGPINATIYNSTQYVNATPNEVFTKTFLIKPSSSGTMMLNLNINTENATLNYSMPTLVLPKPTSINVTNTTKQILITPEIPYIISKILTIKYLGMAVGLIIFLVLIIYMLKSRNKSKYSSDRAEKLRRIRETIKRG